MNSISLERAMVQQMFLDRTPDLVSTFNHVSHSRTQLGGLWNLFRLLAGEDAAHLLKKSLGDSEADLAGFFHTDALGYAHCGIGPYTALTEFDHGKIGKFHTETGGLFDYATYLLDQKEAVENEAIPALRYYEENTPLLRYSDKYSFWSGRGPYCPTIPEQYERGLGRMGKPEKVGIIPQAVHGGVTDKDTKIPLDHRRIGWLNEGHVERAIQLVSADTIGALYMCSVVHEGTYSDQVTKRARILLNGENKAQPNYESLTKLAQIVGSADLGRWIEKRKGVRRALYVVDPKSTSRRMATGIKTLINSEAAFSSLIHYIGRPLEPDDVTHIRSTGLVEVLWKAPWPIIEPLAGDDRVMARLMPHVGEVDPTKLRQCLSDHEKRAAWSRPITDPVYIMDTLNKENWFGIAARYAKKYRAAKCLREYVIRVCGDPFRGLLVTHPIISKEPSGNFDRILGKLSPEEWELRSVFRDRWDRVLEID